MIVRDFNIKRIAIGPSKADTPLLVNPHAMLAFAIAL
jgi:hypothetical protein